VAVLAIHGGDIEPGTSEVAREIAGNDLGLYLFEGILPGGNRRLHVTSAHFDEPGAVRLASRSAVCVSVHGFAEPERRAVCVGGGAAPGGAALRKRLVDELSRAMPELQVEFPCTRFDGADPKNIVNRCTEAALQLELSRAARDAFKADEKLRQRFAQAVRAVLN
jgi:phage replication-related protein YjqB (UPF0714/DUF867 family)